MKIKNAKKIIWDCNSHTAMQWKQSLCTAETSIKSKNRFTRLHYFFTNELGNESNRLTKLKLITEEFRDGQEIRPAEGGDRWQPLQDRWANAKYERNIRNRGLRTMIMRMNIVQRDIKGRCNSELTSEWSSLDGIIDVVILHIPNHRVRLYWVYTWNCFRGTRFIV